MLTCQRLGELSYHPMIFKEICIFVMQKPGGKPGLLRKSIFYNRYKVNNLIGYEAYFKTESKFFRSYI